MHRKTNNQIKIYEEKVDICEPLTSSFDRIRFLAHTNKLFDKLNIIFYVQKEAFVRIHVFHIEINQQCTCLPENEMHCSVENHRLASTRCANQNFYKVFNLSIFDHYFQFLFNQID